MRGRVYGHWIGEWFHTQVGAGEFGDVRQLGFDVLWFQVGQIQQDVVLVRTATAAFTHFVGHGASHDVTRCKVLNGWCVTLHEALTIRVTQDRAFTTCTLGQKDAQACKARWVELEELHVFQWQTGAEGNGHAVAGQGVCVGGGLEDLAGTARSEDHGLSLEDVQFAGGQVVGDDASNALLLVSGSVFAEGFFFNHQQIQHVVLVVELNVVLDAVLVQGLQDHVAGAVCCVAGATYGGFAVVAGVATETTLVNLALWGAVERQTHLFQVQHGVDGFLGHNFCCVLVNQVVATLDGVEGVPFPVVFFDVGKCCTHAALGCTGVRAGWVKLG